MSCAQSQMSHLDMVDAKELGEVVDMIKDLEEAIYYCTIVKAMEERDQEPEHHHYYTEKYIPIYYDEWRDMDRGMGKMYYRDETMSSESREYPTEMRDYREGASPIRRKYYMEGKERHQDKKAQMEELERYMKELSQDITEMIKDASPEETQLLRQKLVTLSEKIK